MPLPDDIFTYETKNLKNIPYEAVGLEGAWDSYDIQHELTDKGLVKFAADWNSLIA